MQRKQHWLRSSTSDNVASFKVGDVEALDGDNDVLFGVRKIVVKSVIRFPGDVVASGLQRGTSRQCFSCKDVKKSKVVALTIDRQQTVDRM